MARRSSTSVETEAPLRLTTTLDRLHGVGKRTVDGLRALGIKNVGQLIYHLPTRYEFEEAESRIADLRPGVIGTARGEITGTRVAGRGRRDRFEAVLHDGTSRLDLVFFNQVYLLRKIVPGMRIRVQGQVKRYGTGVQMANPRWSAIVDESDEPSSASARFRPVYPASEDCPSRLIEQTIDLVLERALELLEDHLPATARESRALPELRDAYRMLHRPTSEEEIAAARRRVVYDELFLLQLAVHMKRAYVRRMLHAPALKWNETIDAHIRARIPFELTDGQNAAIEEIIRDLQNSAPANRLIQGDVGSGKTAVALYAMLMAVASKRQAAFMAPTELLAEQHWATVSDMLRGSSVRMALLTGGLTDRERRDVRSDIAAGRVDLVIGTHALLTEGVEFPSLGVAVVDEQHRFGVHQRARLKERSKDPKSTPHTLVMTATPIPRTLALTIFGDLDVSTIRGLPKGRQPIATRLVTPEKTSEVYEYLRKRVDNGEQAYVVVPAIESTGRADRALSDVRSVLKRLEEHEFAGKRLAAIHGRLKRDSRERIMERFRQGLIDVLVATTVIEVGIDVPSATIMVIEHAERFGLAQLHQLRGRIGRGSRKSICVLISSSDSDDALARLRAVAESSDGFALAEKDLELRGPGEIIGQRQAGIAPFRLAEFPRDTDLLLMARRDAAAWIERSPALSGSDEALLRRRVLKAHGRSLGLADVA